MRQLSWCRWMILCVLAAVPAVGCRHAEHECDCGASTLQPASSVVMMPSPAPAPQPVIAATATKPAPEIEPAAAKKPQPLPGSLIAPMVTGSNSSSKTGTLELTSEDAEAMGVKPGYTPGALYMPPK